jgi:hypothetical protein
MVLTEEANKQAHCLAPSKIVMVEAQFQQDAEMQAQAMNPKYKVNTCTIDRY